MLASDWSAGIEYLHADFGGPSANLNAFGSTLGITSDVSADVVCRYRVAGVLILAWRNVAPKSLVKSIDGPEAS
jgi:hypothetical protein